MPTAIHASSSLRRGAFAIAALALLVAAVAVAIEAATGWWQLAVFAIAPDVALLAGAGSGLERGQLHPRAVPLYNALHRLAGPLVLAALAVTGLLGTGWLVAALAWGCHVCLDRAVGYGLRTREGFQRA
jgi:Domain of unknown function (DUF4260)